MAGELSFFEIGVEDTERGRAFYERLFGWRFDDGPSGPGSGWVLGTPTVPGGMHGGDRTQGPYVFFRIDDMAAALERVRELGGSVQADDMGSDEASVERFGRFRLCTDDQGSGFGLHEPPGSG